MRALRSRSAAVAWYLAFVAALAALVWWQGHRTALDQLERRGGADLALASDRLTSQLQGYRELAVLMAEHPGVVPVLVDGAAPGPAESLLLSARDKTGPLDIVVVDAAGRERAAAQGGKGRSHAGEPWFERAMDGALGVHHLFSPRWARRVFLFAAPVFAPGGRVAGAVVVAVDLEAVEAAWRGDRPTVFFTDARGVVFLSNRSELLYRMRAAQAGSGAAAESEAPVPFVNYRARRAGGRELWDLDAGRYLPRRALHLTLDLPVIGMTGEALIDTGPARRAAALQASAAAALCLALGALLFMATERRRTLAQANARLEARVAARTAELQRVNADLRREVAERSAAEARLRQAQADLVQAGKLSALGQMSAGISHELNQPLMAIRSFAENGEALLARGRTEAAAQNLARIAELGRRMGRIIRNLRAFARQESEPLGDVDLGAVVEAVVEMVEPQARHMGVKIGWTPPAAPLVVRGGEVRLQQVVLNLVSNAMDAMAESRDRRIEIAASSTGARVLLSVRDTGPGIAEPERIFDPFYTTKQVGASEGMGLGLSISYGLVQSFGGAIRGRNHPGGGAVFTVELDVAAEARAA